MNKLLVSDIINLNDGEYDLDIQSNKLNLIIDGKVKIYITNTVLNELNIDLNNNSQLDFYMFNNNINNNLIVNIKQMNNTVINYNDSIINNNCNKLVINNDIKGNNNKSIINVRNISNNNDSNIIINVTVFKDTINNIALEDLKGITNGGFIHIEPNIICESNEVEANHLTTIGPISKDLINYLMSKNISEKNAINILLKGFKYSNMDEYIKRIIGGE